MLNKKICFITGGSRGIGRTIVNSFLENNAIVVFTYLENENSANDLFEEVEKKYKSRLLFYQMDVSDRLSVRKTLSAFKKSLIVLMFWSTMQVLIVQKILIKFQIQIGTMYWALI